MGRADRLGRTGNSEEAAVMREIEAERGDARVRRHGTRVIQPARLRDSRSRDEGQRGAAVLDRVRRDGCG